MADLDLYDVTVRGHVTQMRLSKEDAEFYGAKKIGSVEKAEPQPVTRPPYADASGEEPPAAAEDEEPQTKRGTARNKARSADDK